MSAYVKVFAGIDDNHKAAPKQCSNTFHNGK